MVVVVVEVAVVVRGVVACHFDKESHHFHDQKIHVEFATSNPPLLDVSEAIVGHDVVNGPHGLPLKGFD